MDLITWTKMFQDPKFANVSTLNNPCLNSDSIDKRHEMLDAY